MQTLVGVIRSFIFGPFLVLAFLAGAFVFWKKGGEEYYDQDTLLDVLILSSWWGLVAARLGFIFVHIDAFGFDIPKWLSLFAYPGYVGMFGLAGGLAALLVLAKRQKWNVYEAADFSAMGTALALVFISIGMFLNGSGFGNPTKLFIGMTFPGVFDTRHPTQLYSAVLYGVLFIVLWKLESVYRTFLWYRSNKRTAQPGFLLASFLIGYGLIGVLLAFVQPPFIRIAGIHVEGILRALIAVAGAVLLFVRSGRHILPVKKKPAIKQSDKQSESSSNALQGA